MKKFLAMILSAVMLISCLAIMPIGATDNAPATAEDVLYHVDFTKKYAELGLTETTDATTIDNLGVEAFNYQWSMKAHEGTSTNKLTADGLVAQTAYRWQSGFALRDSEVALSALKDYTIRVNMKLDMNYSLNEYVYFGFGCVEADGMVADYCAATKMTYNVNFTAASGTQFRPNGYQYDADQAAAAYAAIVTNKEYATYDFIVEDGKFTGVKVTAGDLSVMYTPKTEIDASVGNFGMVSHCTKDSGATTMTVKSVSVVTEVEVAPAQGTDVLYNVDFTKKYTEMGLTEATDATQMADLGVEAISELYSTSGTPGEGDNYAKLTADGLVMTNTYRYTSGFALLNKDTGMDKLGGNYTVSVDMVLDVVSNPEDYLYYGFGYNPDKNSYDPFTSGGNFRFNQKDNDELYVMFQGSINGANQKFNPADMAVAKALYQDIHTDKAVVTYSFVVENNTCSKVVISCGENSTTFAPASGSISASAGDFVMMLRPGKTNNPKMTVKSVSVLANNLRAVGTQETAANGTFDIRFVSAINETSGYSAIGYDIVAVVDGGATLNFSQKGTVVYRSVNGFADAQSVTYKASDFGGDFFYCATLKNVPADKKIEFTVTPYLMKDGVKVTYDAYTVTYVNGAIA